MNPIKLRINGDFWDSMIYSGRLYLFGGDSSVTVIDWEKCVHLNSEQLGLPPEILVALTKGNIPYLSKWIHDSVLHNNLIEVMDARDRFKDDISIDISGAIVVKKDNPFSFPHATGLIYRNKMYVGSKEGVSSALLLHSDSSITKRANPLSPVPCLYMSSNRDNLYIASGDEGVSLLHSQDQGSTKKRRSRITKLTKRHANKCSLTRYGLICSARVGSEYLLHPKSVKDWERVTPEIRTDFRTEDRPHDITEHAWGARNLLYRIRSGTIEVYNYSPMGGEWFDETTLIKSVDIAAWKGRVLSSELTHFGIVVEYENAIVVVRSDGVTMTYREEPVNWRTYSNSKYYMNHLHIINEDHVQISVFLHDYFLDYHTRLLGLPHH